jgi:PAS domain S-box-containing protein
LSGAKGREVDGEGRRMNYQILFQSLPVPALLCNLNGQIHSANHAALALFPDLAPDPCGRSLEKILAPNAAVPELQRTGQSGHSFEVEVSTGTDGPRIMELTATCLETEPGQEASVLLVFHDLRTTSPSSPRELDTEATVYALRESEGRFRALIEDLDVGVVLQDPEDRVLISNRAARDLLGLELDDLGRLTSQDPRWHLVREDGTELPPEETPSVIASRTLRPVRNQLLGANRLDTGERRWLRVSAVPRLTSSGVLLHVLVSISDVSEKRKQELCLLQSEEKLRRLNERFTIAAESAGLGVFEFDLLSQQLIWDDAMCAMYDVAPGEFATHFDAWLARIHPEDLERVQALGLDAARGLKAYDTEFRVITRAGATRHVRAFARILSDAQGRPARMVGINFDITEQRRMEEQLKQSQKLQAIGQLAGGVAHDFNNLLTIISGYSESLLHGTDSFHGAAKDKVEQIRGAAQRAAQLTRQLLLFSRKAPLQAEILDINDCIHSMSQMLRRIIEENVEFALDLCAFPALIEADPSQVEQVVMNLCLNARDSMSGGGRLRISTSLISMDALQLELHPGCKPGSYVQVEISDTGAGMESGVLERIFEPFFTTKPFGKGTGLGLATVYGSVKQSGGFITVNSRPGAGSTFLVHYPCARGNGKTVASSPVRESVRIGHERVLLAEDEPHVRTVVRESLEALGYHVVDAPDGMEALNLFTQNPGQFDVLVSDIVMPEMSGIQLASAIQRRNPSFPVILISGYASETELAKRSPNPNQRFVQKPFTPSSLARVLRELLDQSDREQKDPTS